MSLYFEKQFMLIIILFSDAVRERHRLEKKEVKRLIARKLQSESKMLQREKHTCMM